jgi:hypothetical protein
VGPSVGLTSSFVPSGYMPIKLAIAEVLITKTGKVSISWPDLNDDRVLIEDAMLSDNEFAHGKTQRVYLVRFF